MDFAAVYPTDNLLYVDDEIDFADVLDQIQSDFGVDLSTQITEEQHCTFDSLLRAIAAALHQADPVIAKEKDNLTGGYDDMY